MNMYWRFYVSAHALGEHSMEDNADEDVPSQTLAAMEDDADEDLPSQTHAAPKQKRPSGESSRQNIRRHADETLEFERPKKKSLMSQEKKPDAFRKTCKQNWSTKEKAAIHRQLSGCIIMNKVPNQAQAQAAIDKEADLSQRTWRSVKYFVYNVIQKQKKQYSLH